MNQQDKDLLIATKEFATENRLLSWWHLAASIASLITSISVAMFHPYLWVAIASSLISGLTLIRMFVMYHDYLHGAILKDSKFAKWIFQTYGMFVLSPANVWKETHDSHHQNNCKSFGYEIGSFPLITVDEYFAMSSSRQLGYRIVRNPMIIVFGYLTSFMWNKCLRHFLNDPAKFYLAGVSFALHVIVLVALAMISWQALILGALVPFFAGCGFGTYLSYAQHNFPGMHRLSSDEWSYVDAALKSSSYLKTGRVLSWMTGNIGYHHVHHLNAKIPFYRLPEAMRNMVELQSPTITSLRIKDIFGCLNLKLWCSDRRRLINFREAALQQQV